MTFIILFFGIALLIVLITWVKLNGFLSFILVSLIVGLLNRMSITDTTASLQKGLGNLLGSLAVILALGAMLGKLIADSGAGQKIASGLMEAFGRKYLVWALVLAAFIIGIPLFYGVGFVLLVPIIITISVKYNIPAVYIGLPMLAALSVTHGYLPPHPSPTALVSVYHADLGLTLLYGFIIAIPAIIIAGPLFALSLKKYRNKPMETFAGTPLPENELPSLFLSVFTAVLPVLLIALSTIARLSIHSQNIVVSVLTAVGDPVIALLITLFFAVYFLGLKRKKTMGEVMQLVTDAVKDIAMILLIIGGAGALNQVLTDSGTSQQISASLQGMNIHPLLAAWLISAIFRVCVGSATVAGITAAGIVAPLMATSGVNPSLMVLATGAGSLMFSHVNDPAFWMFKEYFNLSLKDTVKTWSFMETIVSVVGIVAVFVLNLFIS